MFKINISSLATTISSFNLDNLKNEVKPFEILLFTNILSFTLISFSKKDSVFVNNDEKSSSVNKGSSTFSGNKAEQGRKERVVWNDEIGEWTIINNDDEKPIIPNVNNDEKSSLISPSLVSTSQDKDEIIPLEANNLTTTSGGNKFIKIFNSAVSTAVSRVKLPDAISLITTKSGTTTFKVNSDLSSSTLATPPTTINQFDDAFDDFNMKKSNSNNREQVTRKVSDSNENDLNNVQVISSDVFFYDETMELPSISKHLSNTKDSTNLSVKSKTSAFTGYLGGAIDSIKAGFNNSTTRNEKFVPVRGGASQRSSFFKYLVCLVFAALFIWISLNYQIPI